MKSILRVTGIIMTAVAILALSGTAGFAKVAPQGIVPGTDVIVLTENHARTIAFDLDATAFSPGGLHSLYLLSLMTTAATGNLKIYLAFNSPITQGQEAIYFVTGYILGATPFLQYVYATQGTFGATVVVPQISFGALLVGVVYSGGIDFPITMRATVSLTP